MLEQDAALRLLLMSGALHLGRDLLMRVHVNENSVLGHLLLHENDLLGSLQ